MKNPVLRWREKTKRTQLEAAKYLGVTERLIKYYEAHPSPTGNSRPLSKRSRDFIKRDLAERGITIRGI